MHARQACAQPDDAQPHANAHWRYVLRSRVVFWLTCLCTDLQVLNGLALDIAGIDQRANTITICSRAQMRLLTGDGRTSRWQMGWKLALYLQNWRN